MALSENNFNNFNEILFSLSLVNKLNALSYYLDIKLSLNKFIFDV